MPGRLGPRFAIEALFLIALAVGVAYADLASKWIVAVMAGGWLVVALLELAADRIWATAPPWRRPYYYAVTAQRAEAPPTRAPEPKPKQIPAQPAPLPEPEPAPVAVEPERASEEATVIAGRPDPATPPPELEPEPEPVAADRPRPTLEPIDAKPKRRWFRREHEEVPDETTEIPMPKHVRLLPPSDRRPAPDDVAELFDEQEENTLS
jgi:hypothetical protein